MRSSADGSIKAASLSIEREALRGEQAPPRLETVFPARIANQARAVSVAAPDNVPMRTKRQA